MQLLQSSEPWHTAEMVVLGGVFIQMLLDTAYMNDRNGNGQNQNRIPAFTYEKKWVTQNKLQGIIVMNEDLYHMMVHEKHASLDNSTMRHKPMVIPPKEWTSIGDCGYSVLTTDFMTTHGCQIQQVRRVNGLSFLNSTELD